MKELLKNFLSWSTEVWEWMKAHDKIVAVIVVAILIAVAIFWSNMAQACEDHSRVYVNALVGDAQHYCHRTETVGELGIDLYGGGGKFLGGTVQPVVGYQHESCWAEQSDKATMDALKAGVEFRW